MSIIQTSTTSTTLTITIEERAYGAFAERAYGAGAAGATYWTPVTKTPSGRGTRAVMGGPRYASLAACERAVAEYLAYLAD